MRLAVLVLLAGCDQIIGLTPPDEPDPTVPPRTVTLTYDRIALDNTGPTAPTLVDPETLSVTRLDGTEIPMTRTGLGTFEFTTDAATYVLSAATPFGGTQLQFGGATVHLRERVLGRTARTPPPANTRVDFELLPVVDPGNKAKFTVHTTGLWAQLPIESAMAELDYPQLVSLTGPLGLIDSSKGDELFLLEAGTFIDADTATSRFQLIGYARSAQALVPGGTIQISGSMTATATSHCVRVTAPRNEELARLSSVAPSSFGFASADWTLSAIPHDELHGGGGAVLAQHKAVDAVTSYDVRFENPIPGKTIASLGALRTRFYTVAGANVETQLVYEVRTYNAPIPAAAGPCIAQPLPAGRIALVDSISVDGKVIARDDLTVDGSATKPLDITWSPTEGDVDLYTTYLVEVVPRPAPASTNVDTIQVPKIGVTTTGTRAVISRDYLERGHFYFIAVESNTGFPKAGEGDFSTIAYPRGITHAVSGVFRAD